VKTITILSFLFLTSCMKPPYSPTEFVLEWYCNANQQCTQSMGSNWGRDFEWPSMGQCLQWQQSFVQEFPGATTTPCTQDN